MLTKLSQKSKSEEFQTRTFKRKCIKDYVEDEHTLMHKGQIYNTSKIYENNHIDIFLDSKDILSLSVFDYFEVPTKIWEN